MFMMVLEDLCPGICVNLSHPSVRAVSCVKGRCRVQVLSAPLCDRSQRARLGLCVLACLR